ncbi:MAG: SDR family oxidoreductase [Beijerinckiaceae bacterium]
MNLFVFGLGYSAMHYVRTRGGDTHVAGTVRTKEKAETIRIDSPRIEALVFDNSSADAAIADRLATTRRLLISIPPSDAADPVLAIFKDAIAGAPHLDHIVYLSTIGVYGDHGGAWIDEDTPPQPNSARARARLAAEAAWIALGARTGKRITILRLAGIYGPGRNALVNLRAGTARRLIKPGQVFNRIHVEDIARTVEAAFASDAPSGIFNVTDDEPAPPQDVIAYAAELAGFAAPPESPFATADLTPMARSFYSANKRVSNRRLKERLGVVLAFPTYRVGLQAL